MMKGSFRSGLLSLGLVFCVGCDQAAKAIARGRLAFSPPVSFLGGAVRFEYTENPGAFLSLGAGLPPQARFLLGVVFVAAALAALLVFTLRSTSLSPGQKVGLSLLVGGGLGNLIDRVANHGHVIDFVSVGIGPLRTGIFNVADMAITAGVLVVLVSGWRERAPEPSDARAQNRP
ncbi:MAG TPA: signal peptidase II [Thermoanaerobaculia bacterium]|jgi:signal peptidase II|nr:signal peptidase II [Thermoanaerobaculia bacterium]